MAFYFYLLFQTRSAVIMLPGDGQEWSCSGSGDVGVSWTTCSGSGFASIDSSPEMSLSVCARLSSTAVHLAYHATRIIILQSITNLISLEAPDHYPLQSRRPVLLIPRPGGLDVDRVIAPVWLEEVEPVACKVYKVSHGACLGTSRSHAWKCW